MPEKPVTQPCTAHFAKRHESQRRLDKCSKPAAWVVLARTQIGYLGFGVHGRPGLCMSCHGIFALELSCGRQRARHAKAHFSASHISSASLRAQFSRRPFPRTFHETRKVQVCAVPVESPPLFSHPTALS